MKVVKIASAAALAFNLVGSPINVFASANPDGKIMVSSAEATINSTLASVKKFDLWGKDILTDYNEVFKMPNTNIKSITNNGGKYNSSTIDKAIDGDMNTHWETGNQNSATFTNEVVIDFNEATTLNRIVYAARQDSAKGKGFAQEFEIYRSTSETGDDFTLVTEGKYTGSTGDIVEIQFTPTQFKRVKFVFKKANQDWASASEFQFYKEDSVSEKMNNLFTDHTYSAISKDFNTTEALNQLETEVKDHPLYPLFKEDIENAQALLNQKEIVATKATVSKLKGYGTKFDNAYSEAFRMPNSNVSKVTTNGGSYPTTKPEFMLDDQPNTHWETNKNNDANFTNEVVFELENAEVLDRVAFLARSVNQKGFPEKFEIYASETSKGETFQLVSSGEAVRTSDFLEFKFEPTKFKRIKFKFTKAYTDRPFAAEFRFYKEDAVSNKMDSLFTDKNKNQVSEQFNSVEKLQALEESVKSHPLYETFKEDIANALILIEQEDIEPTTAVTKPFEHYSNEEYSKLFRMDLENIQSIRNNAGHYGSSVIGNATDGNLDTYWETDKGNSANFSNEVEVTFKKAITLDRVMYGARKSDRKGFAEEFEIYASQTSVGDTYQLVSTGQHKVVAGLVEAKFEPTKFKRIKFKFKKSTQSWASLSELAFYKEDVLAGKMANLFTDEHKNKVSEPFNTLEKLEAFEQSVQSHPLYEAEFKEDLENAKALIEQTDIVATIAATKPFEHYSNEDYSKLFKMENDNIKSIQNNGGKYGSAVIENAIDGNLDTYWETNTGNSTNFTNEVEVEFKEAVKLNRIMYGARKSDRKGFAEEFEIYASQTSKGDTYQLVATGGHNVVAGLVEAKFEPTTFKRVKFKFKKSTQNWASLAELAFYTEDVVADKVNNIFTDGTMSAVVPEFNSVDKINALENEAKAHPLYNIFKERLDLAKKIVQGEVNAEDTIVVAEQHGDMVKHAKENLKFGFGNNLQPTGFAAQPGDKITVYVDADANGPLPKLSFAQQDGSFANWRRDVALVPGKNEITVPQVNKDSWYKHDVTPGGSIYIINPYTAEQQGKAPKIRFEGVEKIPFATKDTNVVEFKSFLKEYKQKLDEDIEKHPNVEDREVVDVFEFVSDHIVWTGTATGAYKTYIEDGFSPLETIESYNTHMEEIFRYYGLDASNNKQDPKLIREHVRLAQPFGYMYAYTDHIGVQGDVMANHLIPFEVRGPSWGLTHEIGHKMDVNVRLYGEITNNMLPQHMSVYYGKTDNRIPYEGYIYNNVIEENLKDYNSLGTFERLGVFWQLEMYSPGYWGKLNSLYRERDVQLTDGDSSKQQYLVQFSSEVLKLDLSEYFARHGFTVNKETREITSKYKKPNEKIWYLNSSVADYKGNGIKDKKVTIGVNVVPNAEKNSNTLNFTMDKSYADDFLGYEIIRNGKVVGFTSTNSFIDKEVDTSKNYTYQVVAYDKKLKALEPVEFSSLKPTLAIEDYLTLKLHQDFDPMDYVKATSYQGEDITKDVEIKSNNVDLSKKGNYEIVYTVKNADITETKTTKVTVTSDYAYISDMDAKLANIAWGGLKKDLAPSGSAITLVRQGVDATYDKGIGTHANSEVVYDIEGKGFDFFESYIGIDQAMKGRPSSATFEVWVDGEKKFASDVFKANTEHEFVKVPVTGAKEVKLVTTDAKNNGNTADHTVWADAKFTQDSSKPTLNVSDELTFVKLNSDFDITQGVEAFDTEDGNLIDRVKVTTNGFNVNKTGTYTVDYTVTDSDNNTVTKSRDIFVYSEAIFASDIDWKSAQTDWKTVNKDQTAGGETIKVLVNGETKEFAKGIGTHANSEIVYNLAGKNYDYFETLVGVDRNIVENNNSSVTFKVLADGEEVFNSGVMNFNTESKLVRIPVKGVNELTLIATDSGNGNKLDHADFADAKFYISNGLPQLTIPKSTATKVGTPIDINEQYTATDAEDGDLSAAVQVTGADQVNFNRAGKYELTYTVTDSDGNEATAKRTISVVNMDDYKYLTDYDWKSANTGWGTLVKDQSISGNVLRLTDEAGKEVTYQRGIGTHSTSTIIYDLTDKDADYFSSFVGVDRQMHGSVGSVIFQVFVDGEKQFDSGLMNSRDPQQFVEVNISGAKELKLVVTDGGNGNGSDHATWGDAKLHFANADRVFTQDLETAIEEAKAINTEDYTSDSVAALQASIAQAEETLANKQATQADIDQAVEMLKQAIEALVAIDLSQVISVPDKDLNMFIKQTLGITEDITLGDMYKLTSLSAAATRTERVASLEGLQYAKNLVTLDITGNEVTDFSPLQGLDKLENLIADPQVIEMPSPTGQDSIFNVENLVKGLDGKHVNPTQIGLRHNKTFKEVLVNVDQLEANAEHFTIDLSEEDKGFYTLVIVYEVEGNMIQIMSIINND